ncbi:MAG TPA: hypothetical protein VF228_17350 [Iamia sp.]
MTAYRWRAADDVTGRLTGHAAEVVEVLAPPEEWADQSLQDPWLRGRIFGASIGLSVAGTDREEVEQLRALAAALAAAATNGGIVTLEREP